MKPILEINNVSKKYQLRKALSYLSLRDSIANSLTLKSRGKNTEFWALQDVSFEVQQGESIGIIGRNGAGKSTLLKILSKITPPTSGFIKARGRVASLLEVGTGFHPELTGRENVYLNGSILGLRKQEIDRKFEEIIDFAGTGQFLETPLKHYSSGMKLRLAFAVAAFLEPEVLVIDEVLAVGDAAFQKKCLGKMDEVTRSGRTVLFVSHNMGSVRQLCPRTIVLEGGQKVFDGPTSQAINSYLENTKNIANEISIGERKDRDGGTKFRFLDVQFRIKSIGQPVQFVSTGEELNIECFYQCQQACLGNEVEVSIAFYNASGAFLFACRNSAAGYPLSLNNEKGKFCCTLEKNPLKKGRYSYNLIAFINGEVVDAVGEAGFIDVQIGDYYGTGKTPAINRPGVCVDYKWK